MKMRVHASHWHRSCCCSGVAQGPSGCGATIAETSTAGVIRVEWSLSLDASARLYYQLILLVTRDAS
jgi:hypothetical protein